LVIPPGPPPPPPPFPKKSKVSRHNIVRQQKYTAAKTLLACYDKQITVWLILLLAQIDKFDQKLLTLS
jgi:hypothetical protein